MLKLLICVTVARSVSDINSAIQTADDNKWREKRKKKNKTKTVSNEDEIIFMNGMIALCTMLATLINIYYIDSRLLNPAIQKATSSFFFLSLVCFFLFHPLRSQEI